MAEPPAHTVAGLAVMNANKPLVDADKAEIARNVIHRYINDEEMADIAVSYGVTRTRIYQILCDAATEDWKSAQAAKALARYDDAETAVQTAEDGLQLAKAREQLRSQQWLLERTLRRVYGQDQQVNGGGNIQINIGIDRTVEVNEVDGTVRPHPHYPDSSITHGGVMVIVALLVCILLVAIGLLMYCMPSNT